MRVYPLEWAGAYLEDNLRRLTWWAGTAVRLLAHFWPGLRFLMPSSDPVSVLQNGDQGKNGLEKTKTGPEMGKRVLHDLDTQDVVEIDALTHDTQKMQGLDDLA